MPSSPALRHCSGYEIAHERRVAKNKMAAQKLQEVANRKERKIFTFKGINIGKNSQHFLTG
jgi:hypothetical protein